MEEQRGQYVIFARLKVVVLQLVTNFTNYLDCLAAQMSI